MADCFVIINMNPYIELTLSYEFPPVKAVAPVRAYTHGLVTTAPNRLSVLRQSPTTAVLSEVRMPVDNIAHNTDVRLS